MAADWIRRAFVDVGVTQYKPGRYLGKLQERFGGGTVLLCIDVSGSMSGRLDLARAGAERFFAEALQARYHVGLILWDDHVVRYVPASRDASGVLGALRSAQAGGGTMVSPALEVGIRGLGPLKGDRVMAIFSDGGIGDRDQAIATARRAAQLDIRIIVRGLGEYAAGSLNAIATEGTESSLVASEADLAAGISSMVNQIRGGLTRRE